MSKEIRRQAIKLYDRFTHETVDRRAFMAEMTRIAGGSAAAASLLSSIAATAAEPVVPPIDPRIIPDTVEWEVRPGRRYPVYRALPHWGEGNPAVMVIHENRGLNDHIRDVARRLAVAGFAAHALDFLGPAGGTPADDDEARRMIGALDLAQSAADGVALIARLAAGNNSPRTVGIVGFCWGGAMVNRLAVAAGDALDAGVVFYGSAPPLAEAPRVRAPLLIHLAERDERVNATALPWIASLRNAGRDVRAINHHGVDHAFHNDTSAARYNMRAARRAWAETLAFFERHLRRS